MSQYQLQTYKVNNLFAIETEEEFLIEYNPYHTTEKWVSNRFSDLNTWKAWFGLFVVIIFFIMGGPGKVQDFFEGSSASTGGGIFNPPTGTVAGPTATGGIDPGAIHGVGSNIPMDTFPVSSLAVLAILATMISVAVLYIIYRVSSEPTHLALSKSGIAWEWRRALINQGTRVSWDDVETIELTAPEGTTSALNCVINIKTKEKEPAMKIKLGGLATHEDRQTLLDCIDKWATGASKDPQLIDLLAAPQDQSYTELWLEALSAPPDRERLEPLEDGTVLQDGKYKIVGHLGTGGQGTAYDATDSDGGEIVLKEFILPVYVDISVRKQALERMNNEVKLLQALDHPQIVKLIDFFFEDHRNYLVLEKITGNSLRMMVEQGKKFSEEEVISLSIQMCDILIYLHSLEPPIVHRDFTPDNLILRDDGLLKLLDFNVAQQKAPTVTCTVVGKQAYLPPEQFRGKPGPQSDIYAMGASMYFLLAGEDPDAITSSHPKEKVKVSEKLDALVAKATNLKLNERYASAVEILDELNSLKT